MKRALFVVALASLLISTSALAEEAAKPSEAKKESQTTLALRGGITFDVALANPNFYGIGGLVEPTVSFNDQFGVGLRIDGMALFGIGLGDDVQAGIRVLAGILPKVEYKPWRGPVQLVFGLAGGFYTVAIVGASVSGDRSDVGALAGGG